MKEFQNKEKSIHKYYFVKVQIKLSTYKPFAIFKVKIDANPENIAEGVRTAVKGIPDGDQMAKGVTKLFDGGKQIVNNIGEKIKENAVNLVSKSPSLPVAANVQVTK